MSDKRSISKKKTDELYKIVSDRIMDARIAIAKLPVSNQIGDKIDRLLYDVQTKASQDAIDLFKLTPQTTNK